MGLEMKVKIVTGLGPKTVTPKIVTGSETGSETGISLDDIAR